MFTSIQPEMMKLLLRLIKGNINHIATIRASHRLVAELNHCEWVIAVGNGLDWFYKPNQAIIVGMYSNRPEEAIKKAADIIKKNLDEGRISKESGFVLLASSSFHSEAGVEKPRACERSKENMKFATEVITQYHPELLEMMHQLTVVTNLDNRKFIEVKDVDLD
jgi:hypothetical protein